MTTRYRVIVRSVSFEKKNERLFLMLQIFSPPWLFSTFQITNASNVIASTNGKIDRFVFVFFSPAVTEVHVSQANLALSYFIIEKKAIIKKKKLKGLMVCARAKRDVTLGHDREVLWKNNIWTKNIMRNFQINLLMSFWNNTSSIYFYNILKTLKLNCKSVVLLCNVNDGTFLLFIKILYCKIVYLNWQWRNEMKTGR